MLSNFVGKKIKIISFIILTIAVIGVTIYLFSTDRGQLIIGEIVSKFPFFDFFYSTYEKMSGFKNEIPQLTWSSSTSEELVKLIINTSVSGIIFALLSKIFLNIHIARNQILFYGKKDYEILEEKEKSVLYKIKKFFISILSKTFATFLTGTIMLFINKIAGRVTGESARSIVYAILLILVVAIYCLVYSFLTHASINFALFKTIIFNFLPRLVENFVTISIMLLIYFDIKANGFTLKTIIGFVALFIWCWLADFICEKICALFIGASKDEKSEIFAPNLIALFYLLLMMFLMYYYGYCSVGMDAVFQDITMKPIFNLPELPFFKMIVNKQNIGDLIKSDVSLFFGEIVKSFLFSFLLSTLMKLNKRSGRLANYTIDAVLLFTVIASYSLILFCWDRVAYFPLIFVIVIVILMLFKKFYSIFNILEILLLTLFTVLFTIWAENLFVPQIEGALLFVIFDLVAFLGWRLVKKMT